MIDQIILDEKAARDTALKQGLPMTGFPGILGRAGMDGIVTGDDIRRLLKICQPHRALKVEKTVIAGFRQISTENSFRNAKFIPDT